MDNRVITKWNLWKIFKKIPGTRVPHFFFFFFKFQFTITRLSKNRVLYWNSNFKNRDISLNNFRRVHATKKTRNKWDLYIFICSFLSLMNTLPWQQKKILTCMLICSYQILNQKVSYGVGSFIFLLTNFFFFWVDSLKLSTIK